MTKLSVVPDKVRMKQAALTILSHRYKNKLDGDVVQRFIQPMVLVYRDDISPSEAR